MYRRMNSPKASISPFTPRNFLMQLGVGGAAEAGADGVDKHEVALIEQGIRIVCDAIRSGRHETFGCSTTCLGPTEPMCSQTEAEPGPPLKAKRQRTLGGFLAVERIGDEKHLGLDLAVAALDRAGVRRSRCSAAACRRRGPDDGSRPASSPSCRSARVRLCPGRRFFRERARWEFSEVRRRRRLGGGSRRLGDGLSFGLLGLRGRRRGWRVLRRGGLLRDRKRSGEKNQQ